MKKLLMCFVIVIILIPAVTLAGDIPESVLYYDHAELFIGKVEGCTTTDHGSMPVDEFKILYLNILPTMVFKGELEVGVPKTYTNCDHINILPEKDREYLFGYIDENNFYIWEIESFDGEKIELTSKHDMDKRLEEYINDGTVEEAEIKRENLGRQMSFSDYLNSNAGMTESVTITFADKRYDIDKEEFFKTADSIIVTDVKDGIMKATNEGNDVFEDMIFINITHIRGGEPHDSMTKNAFAAISKYGEVDSYSPIMSRLPDKDFKIKTEDLKKLYNLLPDEVQERLPVLAVAQPEYNYSIYVAIFVVALIAVLIIVLIKKKNKTK